MTVLDDLIEPKILKILRLLVVNKGKHYHLQKIASDANVPLASTFRIVKKLVELDYVDFISVGKFKIYKLAENEKTKLLMKMIK